MYSARPTKKFRSEFRRKAVDTTGSEFLCFDGEEMRAVSEISTRPRRSPGVAVGRGEAFEAVMLTPKRKTFWGTGVG